MIDQELKDLLKDLIESQSHTDKQLKELTDKQDSLTDSQAQTDRQLRELGKQIGGLGEKFGSFTEGMAFPSMEKLLRDQFGMEIIGTRIKSRKNGHSLELDVLAYTNTETNQAFIVEVKSHLREEGLEQMLEVLRKFSNFFPEHQSKQLFGILACEGDSRPVIPPVVGTVTMPRVDQRP